MLKRFHMEKKKLISKKIKYLKLLVKQQHERLMIYYDIIIISLIYL